MAETELQEVTACRLTELDDPGSREGVWDAAMG